MYTLKSQIYLDKRTECYQKIITINKDPQDPKITPILKKLKSTRLSIFSDEYSCCSKSSPGCIIAFLNPSNTHEFLTVDDIPELFTFLTENGYTIDETTTNIMLKTSQKIKNLICFIKKIN